MQQCFFHNLGPNESFEENEINIAIHKKRNKSPLLNSKLENTSPGPAGPWTEIRKGQPTSLRSYEDWTGHSSLGPWYGSQGSSAEQPCGKIG